MRGAASPRADELAERRDRPAPALGLGERPAERCQDGARCARRHRQRRGAGVNLGRLPRPSDLARRGSRADDRAHPRPGVGQASGRAWDVQQPGVGDVRKAPGRSRRPRRAAGVGTFADGRPQALEAGGRRRGAGVAVGVRPAVLLALGTRARIPATAAQHQHRHDQRSRARSNPCISRAAAAGVVSRSYRSPGTSGWASRSSPTTARSSSA